MMTELLPRLLKISTPTTRPRWASGSAVRRHMADLDPQEDYAELARRSLVTLHGHESLVYALFTVAFMKQVAVPTMARTLHRRGTGDIVVDTLKRNDDTIVFFGQLLDHGPTSATGRMWIERLNRIHSHFPLRNADSIYTLATLALDPHDLTAALGASPFTSSEREAHWWFWRTVAEGQHLTDLPATREELTHWAEHYEQDEYSPTEEGQEIARALIEAFGVRCLPSLPGAGTTRLATAVITTFCSPRLREVHRLPDPPRPIESAVRLALRTYVHAIRWLPVPLDRSLVAMFGTNRYGDRQPDEVGYQRRPSAHT